jgi:hypothetical protein
MFLRILLSLNLAFFAVDLTSCQDKRDKKEIAKDEMRQK